MGFEILPIEDGDEEIFEIFTITTPVRWTPQRFVHDPIQSDTLDIAETPTATYTVHTDSPADTAPEHQEFSHDETRSQDSQEEPQPPIFDLVKFDFVHSKEPMIETQVFATSTWHRVIHQNIDPMQLRPYLGWRPLSVVKRTLENTTQMARMIIRHPLRRHKIGRASCRERV